MITLAFPKFLYSSFSNRLWFTNTNLLNYFFFTRAGSFELCLFRVLYQRGYQFVHIGLVLQHICKDEALISPDTQ